ncbi:MAG: helix-turn-helix domain-containing protein [Proteobacteria bacterium]|nr:helix-turn-helix domain-containing protein [Pseudomonadota bacterium]
MQDGLAIKAASRFLGCSEGYLRTLVERGKVPHFYLPGYLRGLRFSRRALQEWRSQFEGPGGKILAEKYTEPVRIAGP